MQKYYRPIEVILKVEKSSYRIQLLSWMLTSPIVLVSNLKRYNPDQEDVKHKEEAQPYTKKKNVPAKVGESLIEKIWRLNEPRSGFQQFLAYWKKLFNIEINWKRMDSLEATFILHRWVHKESVERDVNQLSGGECHSQTCPRLVVHRRMSNVLVMLVQDVVSMAAYLFQTSFTRFHIR